MPQRIVHNRIGDPSVLEVESFDSLMPEPGTLVVEVEAAGVNPIDGKLRAGIRPGGPFTEPRPVGFDGAGIVTAVGPEVEGFLVGDHVAYGGTRGSYASEVRVDAARAVPRPPQVSAAQGASIGIPFGTAYQSLRSLDVGPSDTLLLHAGSGAVGQAAIQFARLWGATVVATASEQRFDRVRALGAIPIEYGPGLADRVRQVAPDGVTVALDCAGTNEAVHTSLELVADPSRIATIVRGPDAAGFGIKAFSGGSPEPLTPAQERWREDALPVTMALLAAGVFSVELGDTFSLADAASAHHALESGARGKLVIVP